LSVEITNEKAHGRAALGLHDSGDVESAKAPQVVPSQYIRRNGRGVPRNQLPLALPRSFKKNKVVFQRYSVPKKKGGRPWLKFVCVSKPSVRLKPDVPFKRDFERIMPDELECSFSRRMEEAIGTAFLRA
jgi:hypothetical protein